MSTTTTAPRKTRALPPLMTLTHAAADRLRSLYAKGEEKLLRIGMRTKGCSGLSYDMSWTDEPAPTDEPPPPPTDGPVPLSLLLGRFAA